MPAMLAYLYGIVFPTCVIIMRGLSLCMRVFCFGQEKGFQSDFFNVQISCARLVAKTKRIKGLLK